MKKFSQLSIIALCFAAMLSLSCKDEEKTPENATSTQASSSEEMKKNMSSSSEVKYNPAHGEEGHRCDLPVGAPLTQSNTSSAQPEMTTSPVRLKGASPKINPPHGEPGHDCSVPVGAELN